MSQVLRIGKVSSINYANGTARVTYEDRGGNTTGELPFLAWAYWMPKIEDRVLVGALSNGSTSAVILGPVWHEGHRPAAHGAGRYHQEMGHVAGEAFDDYSEDTGTRQISAKHIKFVATDDGVEITLAVLIRRIQQLEAKVASLSGGQGNE